MARPYLPALSSSRFPPAIYVVVYHVILAYHVIGSLDIAGALPDDANLREGWNQFQAWCAAGASVFTGSTFLNSTLRGAAVTLSFFFTLSGFVMTYTYLEPGASPTLDKRQFWVARFSRIYPVYALTLVATFPIFLAMMALRQPQPTLADLFVAGSSTILLLQSWSPMTAHAWNPPAWSLSCEAFFYLLFPWLVVWIDAMPNRRLLGLIGIMWVLSLVAPVTYEIADPDGVGRVIWTTEAYWLFVVKFNPILRLPEFISGIALGKIYLRQMPAERRGGDGGGARMTLWSLVAITGICAAGELFPFILLHNGLLTPLFAILIYGLARGGGRVHAFLSRGWMVLCGDATYALYILHFAIITYLMALVAVVTRGQHFPPMAFLLVCLVVGIALSVIVYVRYEVPVRRFLRRRLSRPAATRVVETASG